MCELWGRTSDIPLPDAAWGRTCYLKHWVGIWLLDDEDSKWLFLQVMGKISSKPETSTRLPILWKTTAPNEPCQNLYIPQQPLLDIAESLKVTLGLQYEAKMFNMLDSWSEGYIRLSSCQVGFPWIGRIEKLSQVDSSSSRVWTHPFLLGSVWARCLGWSKVIFPWTA